MIDPYTQAFKFALNIEGERLKMAPCIALRWAMRSQVSPFNKFSGEWNFSPFQRSNFRGRSYVELVMNSTMVPPLSFSIFQGRPNQLDPDHCRGRWMSFWIVDGFLKVGRIGVWCAEWLITYVFSYSSWHVSGGCIYTSIQFNNPFFHKRKVSL